MKLVEHPDRDDKNASKFDAIRVQSYIEQNSSDAEYILDIGMGYGYLVNELRKSRKKAFGIDLRSLTHEGLTIADAHKIPFRNESFDVVTETLCLADITGLQGKDKEDISQVVNEIKRVLKPDGLFITYFYDTRSLSSFFTRTLYNDSMIAFFQK